MDKYVLYIDEAESKEEDGILANLFGESTGPTTETVFAQILNDRLKRNRQTEEAQSTYTDGNLGEMTRTSMVSTNAQSSANQTQN